MNIIGFSKFTLNFYILFFIISLCGYFVFNFNSLSAYTILLYVIYVMSFLLGILISGSLKFKRITLYNLSSQTLLKYLLPISAIAILSGWLYMVRYYGDLSTIIGGAFIVRTETIGDGIQIIPTYVSYMSSFANTGLVIAASRFCHYKNKKDLFYCICFGLLIFLVDLQSFGRVGIVFVIFVIVGCLVNFKIKVKPAKILLFCSFFLFLLMLPRWFRGGGTIEGVSDKYLPYMHSTLPSFFDPFISLYAYYFSGIFSFNELLKLDIPLWLGERNFSSLINLFNRLFGSGDFHRISIIANPVYVPYEHNVYMILGELYMDFNIYGIIFLPIFFGICIGCFFRFKGVFADALKLVFIGWLCYTPIYNLFSFGGFMLAYIFLAFILLTNKSMN